MTAQELKKSAIGITEANASKFAEPLTKAFEKFGIDTPFEKAAFIANAGHESKNFTALHENLNYSAKRLLEVFKGHFTPQTALVYAGKPVQIGNKVYANRYGNRDEKSGDGFRYCGKGLFHLTFFDNYKQAGKALSYPLTEKPMDLLLPGCASFTAAWFWKSKNLDRAVAKGDFIGLCKAINGGMHGIEDRIKRFEYAKAGLGIA